MYDFWKSYNILHCIAHIAAAWKDVTAKCMQGFWGNCLKHCVALLNNFEGFDHNKDLQKINQDILSLTKSFYLQVDAEDVNMNL